MDMKPAKKSPMPTPSWIEPMLPSDGGKALEDVAFDLISSANALAGQIHPIVTDSVGNLVRSMNCYYSNQTLLRATRLRQFDSVRRIRCDEYFPFNETRPFPCPCARNPLLKYP